MVERVLSFVLGDGKTKPEAKRGPSANPANSRGRRLPLKPAAVLGFGVGGLPSVDEEPRSVAVGVVTHRVGRDQDRSVQVLAICHLVGVPGAVTTMSRSRTST